MKKISCVISLLLILANTNILFAEEIKLQGFIYKPFFSNGIPKTGQATQYNGRADDGYYQKGNPLSEAERFTPGEGDESGVVMDNVTGLMWEQKTTDGGIHDINGKYSFYDAISVFVSTLNNTSFAGYSDWRLPNINELQSIIDYSRNNPSTYPVFVNTFPGQYVSSTTSHYIIPNTGGRLGIDYVWFVDFSDASVLTSGKGHLGDLTGGWYRVRAVRGGSGAIR